VTILSMAFLTTLILIVASIPLGIIVEDWRLLGYSLITFVLLILAYLIRDRFYDKMPVRQSRIYTPFEGNGIVIEFHSSKHSMGFNALCVDLNGNRIADIYRGQSIKVSLPSNPDEIAIYYFKNEKIILDDMKDGMGIYAWPKYTYPRSIGMAYINKGESFDDTEVGKIFEEKLESILFSDSVNIFEVLFALFIVVGAVTYYGII